MRSAFFLLPLITLVGLDCGVQDSPPLGYAHDCMLLGFGSGLRLDSVWLVSGYARVFNYFPLSLSFSLLAVTINPLIASY